MGQRAGMSHEDTPAALTRGYVFAAADSTRVLSAAFICSNPVSVFASVPPKSPTRTPLKRSDSMKRLRPPSSCSMRWLCSPSKTRGRRRRPSQRSSRFASTARTVGLNVVARGFPDRHFDGVRHLPLPNSYLPSG
jgi:hypothetical protein